MKRLLNIGYGLLVLLALGACRQDEWEGAHKYPSDGVLRFEGINAQQVQVKTRAGGVKGFFPENSHYRIWAYGDNTGEENRTLRFVACGRDVVNGGMHQIVFPDIPGNEADLKFDGDNDVLDFYGLIDPSQTYRPESDGYEDYVANRYLKEKLGGTDDSPCYTVTRQEDNTLPDLRYASEKDHTQDNTDFIIPLKFRHVLSKVSFEILQEADPNDLSIGKHGDLRLEGVSVINRPAEGSLMIKTGLFEFNTDKSGDYKVNLPLSNGNTFIPIGVTPSEAGSVLLFPMTEDPTDADMLKVDVTIGCDDKERLAPFAENEADIQQGDNGGYKLTVRCPAYSSYKTAADGTLKPLKLEPNFEYVLQFMIMSNDVCIITIVPRVYEWLDGETVEKDEDGNGYEEQDMGQPVTFNGVIWSDRNLGATSAHPLKSVEEWRKSLGYYYQFNRNIPYFPNTYANGVIDLNTPLADALHEEKADEAKNKEDFGGKKRKLYPVVNYSSWGVSAYPDESRIKPRNVRKAGNEQYVSRIGVLPAAPAVPVWGLSVFDQNAGESDLWLGTSTQAPVQPCPKGWRIPTREDFMGIMPGSAFAGNITFRIFAKLSGSGGWNSTNNMKEPDFPIDYYPGGEGMLKIGQDMEPMEDGYGKKVAYLGGYPCVYRHEKNDPKQGYESSYVLSMYGDDWMMVMDDSEKLRNRDFIFNWGVIYAIKNVGTPEAYRVKWEFRIIGDYDTVTDPEVLKNASNLYCTNPRSTMYEGKAVRRYKNGLLGVLVISRYPATSNDSFLADKNGSYEWVAKNKAWWSDPSEVMYLPVCGVGGQWNGGHLYNIGSEAWYATVHSGKAAAQKEIFWLKFAGGNASNQGIFYSLTSPDKDVVSIRCVRNY